MVAAFRWFAALDADALVRVQVLAIGFLILLLLGAIGLAGWLWYQLTLSRESFHVLRADFREKLNLRAVETFARQDERQKFWRLSKAPGSRTSWGPHAPDSLRDPLPPPPSRPSPPPIRDTPAPDTQRSHGVQEWADAVASTPRPPALPDAPESSTPDPSPRYSVQWRDLERTSAKPSQLDWKDSRLKTTELPQMYPLLQREQRRKDDVDPARPARTPQPGSPGPRRR